MRRPPCRVEKLVFRRAHNPEIGGSSPPPATKTFHEITGKVPTPAHTSAGVILKICPFYETMFIDDAPANEPGQTNPHPTDRKKENPLPGKARGRNFY